MHTNAAYIPAGLLENYRKQLQEELRKILTYWITHTQDQVNGGFYGSVNWNDIADDEAPRGIVLYSRICWTFSAAYSFSRDEEQLQVASRAFHYIRKYFVDKEFGGVYWSVDNTGKMLDGKKQIYGQAFCIYALSEYFRVTNDSNALQLAKDLYHKTEMYGAEPAHNGYIEALSREWGIAPDLRLSEKDKNERKSANTHLHLVEAYANLFSVWPDEKLKQRVQNLLDLFMKHMISSENDHLLLFFNDQWQSRSTLVSFGHDIEAAWLLPYCAGQINDEDRTSIHNAITLPVINASMRGLDEKDGGLWYEYDPDAHHLVREKHWWPQAEAMLGFFYAWQVSGEELYLQLSVSSWEFVRTYLRDADREWFWGVQGDYSVIMKEKAGFWKCPYHNGRACMELIKRISSILQQ